MKVYLFSMIIIVGIFLPSCTNQQTPEKSAALQEEEMHREHSNLADNLAHKDIIILDNPVKVPHEFSQVIEMFFSSYLKLEKALVSSDETAADKAAEEMKFTLDLIPKPVNNDEATRAWINHKAGYEKSLREFLHVKDIEEKRSYFSHLSEILYCTFKSFDLEIEDIHVAYCPMAFEKKGAYWLTDMHKIRNPYFGSKMLKCGEIKEIIM